LEKEPIISPRWWGGLYRNLSRRGGKKRLGRGRKKAAKKVLGTEQIGGNERTAAEATWIPVRNGEKTVPSHGKKKRGFWIQKGGHRPKTWAKEDEGQVIPPKTRRGNDLTKGDGKDGGGKKREIFGNGTRRHRISPSRKFFDRGEPSTLLEWRESLPKEGGGGIETMEFSRSRAHRGKQRRDVKSLRDGAKFLGEERGEGRGPKKQKTDKMKLLEAHILRKKAQRHTQLPSLYGTAMPTKAPIRKKRRRQAQRNQDQQFHRRRRSSEGAHQVGIQRSAGL